MDGAQGHKLPHLAQLPVPNNYSEHKLSLLTQPRKIFRKFFSISALRALVPRCRYANRTRFEDIRNLSSCLMRGPEIYPNGNTKRGSAYALSLQCVVHYEISQVSHDDRFAALQIVFVAWRRLRRARSARPAFACDFSGTLPAYSPVTELSGFLSFQYQPRGDKVRKVQLD